MRRKSEIYKRKIEILQQELNSIYFSASSEELLEKSRALDMVILQYLKSVKEDRVKLDCYTR